MLLGFPRFAFLGNACGTGKTVTYAGAILAKAKKEEELFRKGEIKAFRPTLVLTMATVTPATINQMNSYYGAELEIYSAFGDPRTERDAHRKRYTLGRHDSLSSKVTALDPKDPKVC